jgi:hypothetical protein
MIVVFEECRIRNDMKKLLTIVFFAITCIAQAQELSSETVNGFTFPIGSKFVIKLTSTDSGNYDCFVISFEPFKKTVDTWDNDNLLKKDGDENTIVFY